MSTTTIDRIAAVDPVHADTMRRRPTTFVSETLPFYRRFGLVRATVELPHRPLVLDYADDGQQLVQLAGEPKDIYRVNGLDGLSLEASQVGAYLKFFLAHSEGPNGSRLVERPADVPWLASSESDAVQKGLRAAATARLRPVEVTATPGGFQASALVLKGSTLSLNVFQVDAKGTVRLRSTEPVSEKLPVPVTL